MKIEWITCDFDIEDASVISKSILDKTKNTILISCGVFLCKNRKDLKIIDKILLKESLNFIKKSEERRKNTPNLILESLKLFWDISENNLSVINSNTESL